MNTPNRWLAAFGAGIALTLAAGPAATAATTQPSAATVSTVARSAHVSPVTQARLDAAADRFGLAPSPARAALERVINPGDFDCAPTDLDAFVGNLVNSMTNEEFGFLVNHLEMLDLATYDSLLFGTAGDSRYALPTDYAHSLSTTFRDAKRFWDIESGDISLLAMHGTMMRDQARVARILELVFGRTPAAAADEARQIADAVATFPSFAGGNNPLFTLNAFAFTAEGDPDPLVAGVPDKLIFGDGILDALEFMGIASVGPRAVLGHEFGHHVQFEDNQFDSPLTGAEATRRTELMADAFGTYFATHARGLALNTKRVLEAEKTFFEVGDCAFEDAGHHGTPNQRLRSSAWAADLADSARPQGKILPSLTVAALFDQKLPELVAPDAG